MKMKALMAALVLAAGSLNAQQAATSKDTNAGNQENTTETRQQPAKAPDKRESYRFRYTLAELNGKEKINARTFEILTTSRGEVNTKSRVPLIMGGFDYKNGSNYQFQYVDVGLDFSMDAWALPEEEILLKVEADLTTFVKSEDAVPNGAEKNIPAPVITRRTTIKSDAAVAKLGAPTVIGAVEDVASGHSYELSVTVTRR